MLPIAEGVRMVGHDGANPGWRSSFMALPEAGVGIVVLTNSGVGGRIVADIVCNWADREEEIELPGLCDGVRPMSDTAWRVPGGASPSVFRYSTHIMQRRNIYWLITAQWLAHFADEWLFGLPAWCTRHFEPLPDSFWITMMTVLTVPMIMLGWTASRPSAGSGIRLFCAGVQMLFFSNAFFHLITTYVFGEYSPGTATGVVLFLPLSLLLWRVVLREPEVTKSSFTRALVAGLVFHGLVLLNLLVDKSSW